PVGAPMSLLRKNHFLHHASLGEDKDADKQYYDIRRFNTKYKFLLWLLSSFVGGMVLQILKKLLSDGGSSNPKRKTSKKIDKGIFMDLCSLVVVQSLILCLFTILWGWWGYFVFWVLPLLTVMFGLNVVRSCS